MGIYHSILENNKRVVLCKLGTMNNMYYVRKDEAYIMRSFDSDSGLKILFMDVSLIWRFSWPDEDITVNYTNEQTFKESYKKIVDAVAKREIRTLTFNASFESKFSISNQHETNCNQQDKFELLGDRYADRTGFRSIFRCVGCDKLYAFSNIEIEQVIKPAILSLTDYPKDSLEKILQRINPYYTLPTN